MPQVLQPKLLRVIQQKEFYPLGARKPVKSDFRVIAATNQSPDKIRKDLYFRLAQMTIKLPPLRERKDNILALTKHFLNERTLSKYNIDFKDVHLWWIQLHNLLMYSWPGNVRELKIILEDEKCGVFRNEKPPRLWADFPETEFMFDKYGLPPPIVRESRHSWGRELVSFQEFDDTLNNEERKYAEGGNYDVSDEQMYGQDYVNALLDLAKRLASKPKYSPAWQAYEKWKKENRFNQISQEGLLKSSQEDITISRDSLQALLQAKLPSKVPASPHSVEDAIETLSNEGFNLSELNQKFIKKFLESNPITSKSRETLSARAKQLGIDPKTLRKYLQKKDK
jgi:hypothetical protein